MISNSAAFILAAVAVPSFGWAVSASAESAPRPSMQLAASSALPAPPPKPQRGGARTAQELPTPVTPTKSAAVAAAKGTTLALDNRQRAMVERINANLTSVQTLVGDFVQVGPDGRRTDGKFFLQKPGRIRFEYNDPSPIELIADGKSVAIRDRKLATQDLLLLSQTPLRFLISDRIDLLKEGNLVDVRNDDHFVTVTIEEKQALGGTHQLQLMFGTQDYGLKQWTVTDPQGYDTTVALYNLDTSKKPDPGLFRINYERLRD